MFSMVIPICLQAGRMIKVIIAHVLTNYFTHPGFNYWDETEGFAPAKKKD